MIFRHFLWDYSGRLMTMLVGLSITAVLSRILTPADYGVMGIVLAVGGIAAMFLDFGFSSAIVQRQSISDEQLSTIFYLNIGVGILLYLIVFALSFWIEQYYNTEGLAFILHISAISFIVMPLNIVPTALIQKKMLFKQQALRSILISIVVGVVSIGMAYSGWGIWSLVFQTLLTLILTTILNLYIAKWKPTTQFNLLSISSIFRYSSYLFGSSLLNNLYSKIDIFLIGKVFSLAILGQYSRALWFDSVIKNISTSSLISVLLPYFSKNQDNDILLLELWEKYFNLICFSFFMFMGVGYLSAEYLFVLLFGPNWITAAEYFKIIILSGFVFPISGLALSILEAKGMGKAFFQVEILKKLIILPCFFIAYYKGVQAFLIVLVIAYFLAMLLNMFFLGKAIKYNLFTQLRELGKYIFTLTTYLLLITGIMSWLVLDFMNIWTVFFVNLFFAIYYLLFIYILQPATIFVTFKAIKKIL